MQAAQQSVFSFLSASSRSSVLSALDLGAGRSAAIWTNSYDRMSYRQPDGHTFSLYLNGGIGTRRLDAGAVNGWPGALCVMPQGASSEWEITEAFEFVHLYMPDQELRRVFAETFDRDARLMTLPEATFEHAPLLAAALQSVAMASRSGNPLIAEEAVSVALAGLFVDPRYGGMRPVALKGGLSSLVRRRLLDHIEAHLDRQITLQDLATVAGLSEFHLQRMFRASCGVSPHAWMQHRRIERAKALLATGDPIAQVASACGFSSQSHLTRAFKSMTGVTPSAFRQEVGRRPGGSMAA